MTLPIVDAAERHAALDPARSFVVQAPAGAGKTGLLTQRFLRLLATVEEPEEILAITFTRKAATEMRNRILGALQDAEAGRPASGEYARQTAALAAAAVERSRSRDWVLSQDPGRLQIRTIDSLCHGLARRLPLLSRSGGPALAVDDATELYRLAARRTLALADDPDFATPVTALLGHLDNNPARAGNLLATMLARRDQWLRHLGGSRHQHLSRSKLETSLQRLVDETLEQVAASLPEAHAGEIVELARFASRHLPGERRHDPLGRWDGLAPWEGGGDTLTFWRAVAQLLLRKDGSAWVIRKQASADLGFPAPSKTKDPEEKARFKTAKDRYRDLVTALSRADALTDALCAVPDVPDPEYTEAQWSLLEQLPALLQVAYAQLRVIFAERGVTDHTEVNTAAGMALGSDDSPTDLALALDYHLRHILVDEFQDTSRTQFDLLRRLTAGWQPADGHSFFAVGDPMQSIYRFRQADVSLFIEARDRGLGDLPLDSLVLKTNFRSAAQVISWVNDTFSAVFPARDDCDRGAVSYAAATPFHADAPHGGVDIHPFFDEDSDAEARLVADLTDTAEEEGCETIAVLARSREKLQALERRLNELERGEAGEKPAAD
jgi:ATP-dependent exoDNAse (exonuclease V) beta subunit